MSDYISKSALLDIVGEMPLDWEYGKAVSDIYDIIKEQPTISETKIIRKAFERVVGRLEGKVKYYETLGDEALFPSSVVEYEKARHYRNALKIVKEECGISE